MTLRELFYRWIPQSEAIQALKDLAPLPEAERMTTKPMVERKPRSFEEWARRHGRKSA